MRSGPSQITGRCSHNTFSPATNASLFMIRCDFCESRFRTSWNKVQCRVCKRYVHKTCATRRIESLKGEKTTTRTGIETTTTTRAGVTARNASAGRDDSRESLSSRYAVTARAIAATGVNLVATGRAAVGHDERTGRDAGRDEASSPVGLKQSGPRNRDWNTTDRQDGTPASPRTTTMGWPNNRRDRDSARPRPWNALPTSPLRHFRPASGTFTRQHRAGDGSSTVNSVGLTQSVLSRVTQLPPISIPVHADPPLRTIPLSDPVVPGKSVPNAICESPSTKSPVSVDPLMKHPLSVGPSMLSHISKWPYPSITVCVDSSIKNAVSEEPRVSPHDDETMYVIRPGLIHVPSTFWRDNESCKPIPRPPMYNSKRSNTRRSFRQQYNGVSPIINKIPCQKNVPMKFWRDNETCGPLPGPPMSNPISECRPMLNPPQMGSPMLNPHMSSARFIPHIGPPMYNPPHMGSARFIPHIGPPMYNPPHMDLPIINPPHVGPSRFNLPHMGPPMYNPSHMGLPIINPPHVGPSRFNLPHMGPPMYNLPHMGLPIINPHVGPSRFNLPHMGPPIYNPSHMGLPIINPHVDPSRFNPLHMGPPMYNPSHMGLPIINPPHVDSSRFNLPHMGPPMYNPPHMGSSMFNRPHGLI